MLFLNVLLVFRGFTGTFPMCCCIPCAYMHACCMLPKIRLIEALHICTPLSAPAQILPRAIVATPASLPRSRRRCNCRRCRPVHRLAICDALRWCCCHVRRLDMLKGCLVVRGCCDPLHKGISVLSNMLSVQPGAPHLYSTLMHLLLRLHASS